MANITVTVRFGGTNSLDREVAEGSTVGQVANQNVKLALGVNTPVRSLIDGVELSDSHVVEDGDVIDLETVANRKAS